MYGDYKKGLGFRLKAQGSSGSSDSFGGCGMFGVRLSGCYIETKPKT